ncbi:MFS transporter [Sessilibacter sp. MAH2]
MADSQPLERKTVAALAALYIFRMLGLFMVLPVLSVLGQEYPQATPALIGIAIGVYGLTQALLQIPLGLLSDHIGRKPVIIFGLVIFGVGSVIAAEANSIWMLILGRGLQGAGAIAAAIMALLTDLTSEKNRTKAMASLGVSIGVAFAISLVIGPLIASAWGLSGIFWVSAALIIPGVWITLGVVPNPPKSLINKSQPVFHQISSIVRHGQLLRLDVGVFVLHMAMTSMFVVIPTFLRDELALAVDSHWMIYLPVMLVSFIAMVPLVIIAEKRQKMKPVFMLAISFVFLAQIVFSQLIHNTALWVVALFVFFWGFNLLEATLPSLMSKQAPVGSKGTASGVFSTFQFLGAFCGGVVGGFLVQNYGSAAVFEFAAVMILIWFSLSLSMKVPLPLRELVLSADEHCFSELEPKLRQLAGVCEVSFKENSQEILMRVDQSKFKQDSIDGLGLGLSIR